jgi:hypothetical protein
VIRELLAERALPLEATRSRLEEIVRRYSWTALGDSAGVAAEIGAILGERT